MKLMSTADNRQCAKNTTKTTIELSDVVHVGVVVVETDDNVSFLSNCLSPVYRLEEDGSLLERRWCHAYALGVKSLLLQDQSGSMAPGALPPILFKGFILVFVIHK